eukprot:544922_1
MALIISVLWVLSVVNLVDADLIFEKIMLYPDQEPGVVTRDRLVDSRFEAAKMDREGKLTGTNMRFDAVDGAISSLQIYLKTEIDTQSGMINTKFDESNTNINNHFTSSTNNINNKFISSTNNIDSKFITSTNNINNHFSISTNNINNQFTLSTNNINDKFSSLSAQITSRMNSLAHDTNQNFITSTANINYQFSVSTTNINQKYNLLSNQMNVQSAMITTRFNTLAYGLRKNISLTMNTVRDGNVDIINEIQATTDELKFQLEHDMNDVNETVNAIEVEVDDQIQALEQIKDEIDKFSSNNIPSSGKTGINMMIQEPMKHKQDVFEIKPSHLCIFGAVFIGLNMIFMGLIMIIFMKCCNGYPSTQNFTAIQKYDYSTSDIE